MSREQQRILSHIENLSNPRKEVAVRAERYLIRYGVRAMSELIAACDHELEQVRFRAAWALAHTRHPDAVPVLLRLCSDPADSVRYDARVALGIVGSDESVVQLVKLIESGDDLGGAQLGLGRMMPEAFPAVAALYWRATPRIRGDLMNLIGRQAESGTVEALEILREAAADEDEYVSNDAKFWLEELGV